jgi:dTDP-4-dehydrorhamnose 3,5-epimerase
MLHADSQGTEVRHIAKAGTLELAVVRNGPGSLGTIVGGPDAAGRIAGVQLAPLVIRPDDRGYFEELFRLGEGLAANFSSAKHVQLSAALAYPGTVKAFHYHLQQTDLWAPVTGLLQVALYDLRMASPTFGQLNTIYTGALRPMQILIPPGVGHGYKVVGADSALLVYATDQFYNPSDEGRIAWNDPDIRYDWETQRK